MTIPNFVDACIATHSLLVVSFGRKKKKKSDCVYGETTLYTDTLFLAKVVGECQLRER